jgi:hypothetical protein
MAKKEYQKPTVTVFPIQGRYQILVASNDGVSAKNRGYDADTEPGSGFNQP